MPFHTHSPLFTKEKPHFYMVLLGIEMKDQKRCLYPHFALFLSHFSFIWSHTRWLSSIFFFFFLSFWSSTKELLPFIFIFIFFGNSLECLGQRCARANRSKCTCFPVSLQFHIKIAIFSQ
jgi:hypothetical protein